MKYIRFITVTVVAIGLFMTGCKSEGWQAREAYDKVLKMYEKNEIKAIMDYENYYDAPNIDFAYAEFRFGKMYSKEEQEYKLYVFKNKGDGRSEKEQLEKDMKGMANVESSGRTDIFMKDNILVVVPKKNNPKLDQNVYDLFMSYVQ